MLVKVEPTAPNRLTLSMEKRMRAKKSKYGKKKGRK